DIDNIVGSGAVNVDGKAWTARSRDGMPIEKGALVRPLAIEGVKLIVERAQ
ncbi:MAG: NfeD family protein, partial [Oscillospiraceae bacterium]|nr:NfeD family protein [Oscillospiraceae bacterium]